MTLADLIARLEAQASDAERVGAHAPVANVLRVVVEDLRTQNGDAATPPAAVGWRERLWTAPPETRLGVREVAEALGRPQSWVYRAVAAARGSRRLPARRLDGALVFEAGAVREWIERWESAA